MVKRTKQSGFTLMEMLIVVAIIAVLVAVSIPVLANQLEKSREAVDLANVRSAYTEVMMAAMTEDQTACYSADKAQTICKNDGAEYSVTVALKQRRSGWTTALPLTVGGVQSAADHEGANGVDWLNVPEGGGTCTVRFMAEEMKTVLDWSGEQTGQTLFNSADFIGPVPATWKGAGGDKNNDTQSDWYHRSRSTEKLIQLEENARYTITYTIPSGYTGATIQMGTLLFKDANAQQSIKNDFINGQRADSDWISSTNQGASNQKLNYQTVTENPDGSKTVTQTIQTDGAHIYFGANFDSGKDLRTHEIEKNAIEAAIRSITVRKIN